jgi:hypothetical protein
MKRIHLNTSVIRSLFTWGFLTPYHHLSRVQATEQAQVVLEIQPLNDSGAFICMPLFRHKIPTEI